MGAGEGVHERRLPGAVAPDEGDDLTGIQVDRDAVDGVQAAKGDLDVTQLAQRGTGRRRGNGGRCGVGHVDFSFAYGRPVWINTAVRNTPAASAPSIAERRRSRSSASMATAVTSTTPTTMS